MRTQITPRPASDFAAEYNWCVMSLSDVDAELKALERALGGKLSVPADDVDITEDEWSELIDQIVLKLSQSHDGDSDSATLPLLSETEQLALRNRIAQARKAVKYAGRLRADGANPTTTALLPVPYARRIERLLGLGELPIAWLMRINVPAF